MRSIVGFLIHGFLSSLLDAKNHGLKNRQPFRLPWVFRWLLVPLSGSARRRSANPSVYDLHKSFSAAVGFQMVVGSPFGISATQEFSTLVADYILSPNPNRKRNSLGNSTMSDSFKVRSEIGITGFSVFVRETKAFPKVTGIFRLRNQ